MSPLEWLPHLSRHLMCRMGQAHFPRNWNCPKILIHMPDVKNQINFLILFHRIRLNTALRMHFPRDTEALPLNRKSCTIPSKGVQLVATTLVSLFRKKSIMNPRKQSSLNRGRRNPPLSELLSWSLTYRSSRSTSLPSSPVCE